MPHSRGLLISSFPADLQAEFAALNIGSEGYVTTEEVETAVRGLLNERQGRISLKSFDPKIHDVLQELEPSSQGYLGFVHIEEALLALISSKQRSRYSRLICTVLAITTIIFLGATFGLVYLVVDLQKDVQTINGALVDRVTGQTLQTASSDFMVKNGVLVSRPSTDVAARRTGEEEDVTPPLRPRMSPPIADDCNGTKPSMGPTCHGVVTATTAHLARCRNTRH